MRDVEVLDSLDLGVSALCPCPVKTDKRGLGDVDLPIAIGGVTFSPGDWVYVDRNGILRAGRQLA